jgi:hypothetical protein
MNEFPDTEDADNWSVFLFDCPKERVQKLVVALFKQVKEIVVDSLANYTVRDYARDSIKISLRVLRDKSKKEVVAKLENSIVELLRKEDIEPIVNPQHKEREISGWSSASLSKSRAYNRLSEFVVKLAEEGLFSPIDRNEMRHLAINMLFMREALVRYPIFADSISGDAFPQPNPDLISVMTQEERNDAQ